MSPREASLKVEYLDWYPSIEPGIWYPAATIVAPVIRKQREGEPRWSLDPRVLADAQEFRGGDTRPRQRRTRHTDSRPLPWVL
jgi:hypothetical protein